MNTEYKHQGLLDLIIYKIPRDILIVVPLAYLGDALIHWNPFVRASEGGGQLITFAFLFTFGLLLQRTMPKAKTFREGFIRLSLILLLIIFVETTNEFTWDAVWFYHINNSYIITHTIGQDISGYFVDICDLIAVYLSGAYKYLNKKIFLIAFLWQIGLYAWWLSIGFPISLGIGTIESPYYFSFFVNSIEAFAHWAVWVLLMCIAYIYHSKNHPPLKYSDKRPWL
jgi:hypothetical protein